MNSLFELYQNVSAGKNDKLNFAKELWFNIPTNTIDLGKIINNRKQNLKMDQEIENNTESVKILQKELINDHRKRGSLTNNVRDSIKKLSQGFVEVGHQPLFLGGGSFVFNKFAFTHLISNAINLSPLLFVGDHDVVQNELLITRFPQAKTSRALEIKYNINQKFKHSPIHIVPLPSENELNKTLSRMKNNYSSLLKHSKIIKDRQLLNERLDSILGFISQTYYSSSSLTDWCIRIWQNVMIHQNKIGFPMIQASNKVLRNLIFPGYEILLKQDNHEKFIKSINLMRQKIIENGFEAGFGERGEEHLPFYIECPSCELHTRIEGNLESPGRIIATCPNCKEKTNIDYNPKDPDLSDWAEILSPRVDSRTFVISHTFPILVHVGGTGELIYHAQVYKAYRDHINPPIFLKYNAINYNTPWIEQTIKSEHLVNYNINDLDFMKEASSISSAPSEDLIILTDKIKEKLKLVFEELNNKKESLNNKFNETKNRELLDEITPITTYLAQAYGNYSKTQNKQEVSWNWIDIALITNINDIIGIYKRLFREELPFARQLYFIGSKYN